MMTRQVLRDWTALVVRRWNWKVESYGRQYLQQFWHVGSNAADVEEGCNGTDGNRRRSCVCQVAGIVLSSSADGNLEERR